MEDGDKDKSTTDPKGDEDNKKVVETKEKVEAQINSPVLEEAKRLNEEKKELLEREEKLQDRKEKLLAEEKVGGRALAGGEAEPHIETDEERATRFEEGNMDLLTNEKSTKD